MSTRKEGPLARLARKLGLGKTGGGGAPGGYASCWGCSLGRCGTMFDNTCQCCRAHHSGLR
jgi:hypothetical protein